MKGTSRNYSKSINILTNFSIFLLVAMDTQNTPGVFPLIPLFLGLFPSCCYCSCITLPFNHNHAKKFDFKSILKRNINNMFEMSALHHHSPLCWGLYTAIINLHALGLGRITHVAVNYLTVEPLRMRSIAAKPN